MNKNKRINQIMVLTGVICGSACILATTAAAAAAALGHGVRANTT